MRPEDDYPHPVGPESNFNESMYCYLHDLGSGLNGFVRLANRPNEGPGERTICLYLPDGRLAFSFARPEITSNDAFDAAGLRFEVREPLRRVDVSFAGRVSLIEDPAAMADPQRALSASPTADGEINLTVRAVAPPFEHSFDTAEGSFAPNHYEQLLSVVGTVRIGEWATMIGGPGLRDHSWGPRHWQTPWFYRWVHGSTDGFGFMGAYFGRPDGSAIRGGFVWDGSTLHQLDTIELVTERDERDEQVGITVVLRGQGGERKVRGRVRSKVPLRNRRNRRDSGGSGGRELVTRIVEGSTTWTLDDGRVLHGMSEYLDQIVDGRPVGLSV